MIGSISSCSKDDEPDNPTTTNPNKPVKDPDNTVTLNLLSGQGWSDRISLGTLVEVYVNSAYNINTSSAKIVDVGPVAGLGNITSAPESGWKDEAAAIVGHGYVLKSNFPYGDIARLYVDSEMVSTTGAVMGYTVKYQCPMDNQLTLSSDGVSLKRSGDEVRLEIRSGSDITVKSKPDWTNVTISDGYVNVTASYNDENDWRRGAIILSNPVNSQTIPVIQYADR